MLPSSLAQCGTRSVSRPGGKTLGPGATYVCDAPDMGPQRYLRVVRWWFILAWLFSGHGKDYEAVSVTSTAR
jgi:hypothetical protein